MTGVDQGFVAATEARVGPEAAPWLAGLPAFFQDLGRQWDLEFGEPFPTDGMSFLVRAMRHGQTPVVVKIVYPDAWFVEEVAALARWDGDGAVALLDHDPKGAQLLERLEPGTPLADLPDEDEAMERAAAVAEKLWIADPGGIATVNSEAQEWARTMLGRHHLAGRPFERELVHEAVAAIRDLLATAPAGVLLHGNLSLSTIVDAGEAGDRAIDPKPLVGEREFDAAGLMRDRAAALAADPEAGRALVQHRFDLLRERLGLDGMRLKSWALAVAVDEAIWDFEQRALAVGRAQAAVAAMVRDLTV